MLNSDILTALSTVQSTIEVAWCNIYKQASVRNLSLSARCLCNQLE